MRYVNPRQNEYIGNDKERNRRISSAKVEIRGCQILGYMEFYWKSDGWTPTLELRACDRTWESVVLTHSYLILRELSWGTTVWELRPRFSQWSRRLGHLPRTRGMSPLLSFQPKAYIVPDHHAWVFVRRPLFSRCQAKWPAVGLDSQVLSNSSALRIPTSEWDNRLLSVPFQLDRKRHKDKKGRGSCFRVFLTVYFFIRKRSGSSFVIPSKKITNITLLVHLYLPDGLCFASLNVSVVNMKIPFGHLLT